MTAVRPEGRDWRYDLAAFIALAAALTALFALTPLDLTSASLFHSANAIDHWPLAQHAPWSILYRSASWITATLVVLSLGALAAGCVRRDKVLRRHAVFILLSLALGPGLLVNAVFKDHWNRPRPRDVIELGGRWHYTLAPLRGEGGKSFPCGHCSVGFLYAAGAWIWWRRRRAWALASLAVGFVAGAALGVGRMAAGGHFLSDVMWSALLALGVTHLLYHYVLRIPARDEAFDASQAGGLSRSDALSAVSALGGAAILLVLFVTPHGSDLQARIDLASLSRAPESFEVDARTANIDIVLVDFPASLVSVTGELHGFGMPTSRLLAYPEFPNGPKPALRYRVVQEGWFTDLDARLSMHVPASAFRRLSVQLEHGDIHITDATRAHAVESKMVQLDLHTGEGAVRIAP